MKKLLILFTLAFCLVNTSKSQPTLCMGAEINIVASYQKADSKTFHLGYEPGLFVNFSVLNKMGIDTKVTYQHLSKEMTSFNSTTLIQYYGENYDAFGIGPVFYIPEINNNYSFSNLKYGVALGYGMKFMGINFSVEDFDFDQPTIKLKLFMRLGFLDRYVRL